MCIFFSFCNLLNWFFFFFFMIRVLERLYRTDGSLQMSSSRKAKSIYSARFTAEKLANHTKCLSTTILNQVSTTPGSSPIRTLAFPPQTPTTKSTTGHVTRRRLSLPQLISQLQQAYTALQLPRFRKITRGSGGAIICSCLN